jgi:glycosyltransferase involved in cell wall biosynthesis
MNKVKFSIITICYNSGQTIERTIKSVLAQTYTNFEYIIVDGGSTDSTLEIVKKYEPLFAGRLKWKSEPDHGIYDAMNKGILRSNGDIIGIVNSDDWLEADALSNVYDSFVSNNKDENCLYCGGIVYHKNGMQRKWMANLKSFYKQAHLYVMSGIRHPATFVPAMVYKKVGIFNDKMQLSADQDFILRCFYAEFKFLEVNKVLSNMAAGGLSTSGTKKAWEYSKHDRKIMLRGFNKKGLVYYWLFYSWFLRNKIKNLARFIKLYKGE